MAEHQSAPANNLDARSNRLPWLCLFAGTAVVHAWATHSLEGGSLLLSSVPEGIGATLGALGIAVLLLLPLRLYTRKKKSLNWWAIYAISTAIISAFAIWSRITVAEHERGAIPTSGHIFSPAGCAFRVRFPLAPNEKKMSAPLGQYTQADLSVTDAYLRAECAQVAYDDPKQEARNMLEAQASADGLSNATYTQIVDAPGGLWEMRGYKTLDGVSVTYELRTYYMRGSLLTIAVAGKSSSYPPSARQPFVKSVTLVDMAHPTPLLERELYAARALKEGLSFLAENAKRPSVITTSTGLQYEILVGGNGATPKVDNKVTVHYRGTFPDGTEFDSSYARGQPVTFPLGHSIPGWTEAFQLFKVGTKAKLYIHPDLAYGARGAGTNIGPNRTLIFEVELLGIQ